MCSRTRSTSARRRSWRVRAADSAAAGALGATSASEAGPSGLRHRSSGSDAGCPETYHAPMSYPARALPLLTAERFLAEREFATQKAELVHGVVHAMYEGGDRLMTGASDRHNKVTVNAIGALLGPSRELGCELYANGMGVLVGADTVYELPRCDGDVRPQRRLEPQPHEAVPGHRSAVAIDPLRRRAREAHRLHPDTHHARLPHRERRRPHGRSPSS